MSIRGKDQYSPVSPNEYVFRRILNKEDYYNPDLEISVQRVAVGPTPSDTNGLSVFREAFTTAEKVAKTGKNPSGYYVAKIKVKDLISIGLTVIPDPNSETLLGHSIIPELSISAKKRNKAWVKAITLQMAKLASRSIVYSPDSSD